MAGTKALALVLSSALYIFQGMIVRFHYAATWIATLFAALLPVFASAGPEAIKAEIEKRYPEVKVERITATSYNNLFEVFAGGEIFYTDDKATFIILGKVVDPKTRADLTEARLAKLNAIKFDDLPLEFAMKLTRGNGARRIAVFEDPNCGYCKRFEQGLASMDNFTAYIFMYPILAADSMEKSKAIWCSPDRLKAWQDLMLREKAPTAATTCANPIEKIVALGQKMRINGIPVTFFEDGERVPGAITKEIIENKLAALAKK